MPRSRDFGAKGIILSGGPESVTDATGPTAPQAVFELGVPVLGICYGMQTMAQQLGGRVTAGSHREFGYAQVTSSAPCRLLEGLFDHKDEQGRALLDVWMSHGDRVDELPPGFVAVGFTNSVPLAAMADETRRYYAVQFHPEVTHTLQGEKILERFVREICGCEARWSAGNIITDSIARVREQVGRDNVLLGLSGGVDSSVVGALLHRAIGEQLDLRVRRPRPAAPGRRRSGHGNLCQAHGRARDSRRCRRTFPHRAQGRSRSGAQAQDHRPLVRRSVRRRRPAKLQGIRWLAQGTIYPDVIESAGARTGKAHVIKSHHNVGGLPEKMNLKLLEPLRELFKDEVRKLGVELGLPREMVYRHPFPGPGLGVRILGEVTKQYADLLRKADAIFLDELRKHDLYDRTSQAFAVFLPVRSVAVMGDGRRYDYVIALRAVETIDFMTARWSRLPYEFLDLVARRICNEVNGISRVTYDISGKPPATIEWE